MRAFFWGEAGSEVCNDNDGLSTSQSSNDAKILDHRRVTSKRRTARARAALAWVGSGLVGVTLLYLVGMNVFVRTHIFRDAIGFDPGSFRVEYASAYSLLPGRIHVEGLTIRGRDSSVEWILRLDRCDFRVSFVDLLHRRFHASHVRGSGLSFRGRTRLDEVTPSAVALPPVPGFRDPPLTDVGPPEPPLTDENYRLWGAQLDDVVAEHVREIWVNEARYTGDLTIRGRWVFKPLRWLEVGPATIDLGSLEISYGPIETWGQKFQGSMSMTLHPLDLRNAEGKDFVEHASLDADVVGVLRADHAMNRLLAGSAGGVEVTQGVAPVDVRLRLDHGALLPGTRVRVEPFDAQVRRASLSVGGRLDAEIQVDAAEDKGAPGVGVASVHAASLRVLAGSTEVASVRALSADLTSHELRLVRLPSDPSDASFRVDLGGAETDALAYWQSFLPVATGFVVSGAAKADAHAQGQVAEALRGQVGGGATVAVDRLDVRGKGLGLTTRADARVFLQRDDDGFDLSGSDLSLRDLRASVERGGGILHVRVPSLVASARHFVSHAERLTGDVSLDVPSAETPDLAAVTSVLPLPAGLTVDLGLAKASLHADMDLASMVATGRARLEAPNLKLHAWGEDLAGELAIDVKASAKRSGTDLSGTTVEFSSPAAPGETEWWVRARVDDGALSTGDGMTFRGSLSANAKDASPLAAFIAKESPVPRWLVDAVPTKRLQITGDVRLGPSVLVVRALQAKADGSSVELEFESLPQWSEWAMLLEAGIVHAGVRAGDGGTEVVLFNAEPW